MKKTAVATMALLLMSAAVSAVALAAPRGAPAGRREPPHPCEPRGADADTGA